MACSHWERQWEKWSLEEELIRETEVERLDSTRQMRNPSSSERGPAEALAPAQALAPARRARAGPGRKSLVDRKFPEMAGKRSRPHAQDRNSYMGDAEAERGRPVKRRGKDLERRGLRAASSAHS